MKKSIQYVQFVLVLLIVNTTDAQEFKKNYRDENFIETDSSKKVGIYFEKGSEAENAQYIVAKIKNEKVKFTPEEIKAYGFTNGQVYESHQVEIKSNQQKVFLERLTEGKYSLYYYAGEDNSLYFIRYKQEWIKLSDHPAGNFKKTLHEINDCEKVDESIDLVIFTKKSLSKLISLFNQCRKIPFPYAKYGVKFSLLKADLDATGVDNFESRSGGFNSSYSFSFGGFADLPIEVSQFSFYTGINLQYNQFNYQQEGNVQNLDLRVNLFTLEAPLYLRYTVPVFKLRPYLFGGTSLAYNFINNYEIEDKLLTDYEYRENLVSDFMYGLAGGLGLQVQRTFNKAILVELKYHIRNGAANTMDMSQVSFAVSYEL